MEKIFSILLVCCTAFAFANDEPIFEPTDETIVIGTYRTFAAEEPIFEETDDTDADIADDCEPCIPDEQNETCASEDCEECPENSTCDNNDEQEAGDTCDSEEQQEKEICDSAEPNQQDDQPAQEINETVFANLTMGGCRFYGQRQNPLSRLHSYMNWPRYKANFGIEKLFMRFPQKPAISQTNYLLTAYAYDYAVMYSVTGYFPPLGQIDHYFWHDEVVCAYNQHPYVLISSVKFQADNGDMILDYTSHDYVQNLIIKGRAIVTPFNAYSLQCIKPNGMRDNFDYFIDNFWIKCECN